VSTSTWARLADAELTHDAGLARREWKTITMSRPRPARVSWRRVMPGMRLFDPSKGNPLITAIVPTTRKTRRELHTSAAMATSTDWRFAPKAGFVKILNPQIVRVGQFDLDSGVAAPGPAWEWPAE
jgi:hypothetical protein